MSIIEKALERVRSANLAGDPVAKATEPPATPVGAPTDRRRLSETVKRDFILTLDNARLEKAGLLAPGNLVRQQLQEFRGLKRALLAALAKSDPVANANLVALSSATSGEGKTFISFNLAQSLAMELDRQVVLIDSDLPKRDLTEGLGLSGRPGLSDLLRDPSMCLADCLVPTSSPRLYVLPAGTPAEDAAELLGSRRMAEISLQLAEDDGDNRIVIFDSPPILLTAESSAVIDAAGSIVIVVRAMVSARGDVLEVERRIDESKNLYAILNAWEPSKVFSRSYGYGYYGTYGNSYGVSRPSHDKAE